MKMRDPKPIMGYPVCQLGCILACTIETDGIAICPEKDLIAGYNDKLVSLKTNRSPNQATHQRPVLAP
jgi:hypothetical protein